MLSSNKLLKIANLLKSDYLYKYKFFTVFINNKLFVFASFKDVNNNNLQKNIKDLNFIHSQIIKHINYINSPVEFNFCNNKPQKINNYYVVYGFYNCDTINDDDIKKIVAQWQTFGFKNNDLHKPQKSKAIFVKNSIY